MRKESWCRGALLSVLFFGVLVLFAVPMAAQLPDGDVTDSSDDDGEEGTSGNDATQTPLGGDLGGSPAPDVPTEQPKGLIAGMKRSLVNKIWNSLDADQQQQARDALQDWLEEQGYESCHAAAADPETARHAAGHLLSSDGVQISESARKWANRLLRISSDKGMSTTATIICNQMGL